MRSQRDDRGVTAMITAITITGLLSMGALAVDLGRQKAERRVDQTTVDVASLSAGVVAAIEGGELQDSVDEAVARVDDALGRTVSAAAWAACVDDDALENTAAELSLTPTTDCISFSETFAQVRVQLPTQEIKGLFGPAVGLPQLTSSADASATIEGVGAGAPPFVALSTATKGDFICLRTGGTQSSEPLSLLDGNGPGLPATPGLRADPCDDNEYPTDSSTFGTLLPHAYTDGCAQREAEKEIAVSIGIDHPLGTFKNGYTPGDPERIDGGNNCTVGFPNTIELDTGFTASGLRCAMLSLKNGPNQNDCNNENPRLWQGPNVQSAYKVVNEKLDNTPPWHYLRDDADLTAEGAPADCIALATNRDDTALWEHYDKLDAFMACMTAWDSTTDSELFVDDINESPRFAFVPQVYEATITGSYVHIIGFVPIFMMRLYISHNNASMCDPADVRVTDWKVHDAGQTFSCGASNENIDKVAALVMSCGMLPSELCDKESADPTNPAGTDIYDVLLGE